MPHTVISYILSFLRCRTLVMIISGDKHWTTVCASLWPTKPLFVRISASDWAEWPEKDETNTWRQWGIEQSTLLVGKLQEIGVDLVNCSSGGNWVKQKIAAKHGYHNCSDHYLQLTMHISYIKNKGSLCGRLETGPSFVPGWHCRGHHRSLWNRIIMTWGRVKLMLFWLENLCGNHTGHLSPPRN